MDGLQKLVGETIKSAQFHEDGRVVFKGEQDFTLDDLVGGKIQHIFRSGKYIIFEISKAKNDSDELEYMYMLAHLGMTGGFLISLESNHVRVSFNMGDYLFSYYDIRKFGSIKILNSIQLAKYVSSKKLGIDALLSNKYEIEMHLVEKFFKYNHQIKRMLLDQSIISGLGNIYVNEVLFRSGIHPKTKPKDLMFDDIKCLSAQIVKTLNESYLAGGSSIKDYYDVHGIKGSFQNFLYIYGRKDQPCKICETKIVKIEIAKRSTYFCPTCQPIIE